MRFILDKFALDQAEGLRRLLSRSSSRVIAMCGGASGGGIVPGCTSVVVNLAAALAAHGKDVLVIDERHNAESASRLAGVHDNGSLAAVLSGKCFLQDAATRTPFGFSIIAAPRNLRISHDPSQCRALLDGPADVVLIDAQLDRYGELSSLAAQAHDFVIVTRVAAAAITEAYAGIKRLHYAHAIPRFHVIVNHVKDAADARVAFDNLAGVASRYLAVQLSQAGCVAEDPRVARAAELSRCAVEAFPATPAARDYRHIAAEILDWPMRNSGGTDMNSGRIDGLMAAHDSRQQATPSLERVIGNSAARRTETPSTQLAMSILSSM
jgi:flagellar biosynthesis protein FlhG